jgi:hypothetical protein
MVKEFFSNTECGEYPGLWAASGRFVMNWRFLTWIVLGLALALLGLLWLLQGADLVHIRPILCIADCKPVEGGSIGWMIAGVLLVVGGTLAIRRGARARGRPA